jgi:hypothetical protein
VAQEMTGLPLMWLLSGYPSAKPNQPSPHSSEPAAAFCEAEINCSQNYFSEELIEVNLVSGGIKAITKLQKQ